MSSIQSELARLAEEVHPLKKFFRTNGIKHGVLAKYLKTSPARVSEIMNRNVRPSQATEQQLQKLADRIKEESNQ